MRSKSLDLGSESFLSTVSVAKRVRIALRSWKLETMFVAPESVVMVVSVDRLSD
jgi:hypothetical protein